MSDDTTTPDRPDLRRHRRAIALTDRAQRVAAHAASEQAQTANPRVRLDERFVLSSVAAPRLGIPLGLLRQCRRVGLIAAVRSGETHIFAESEVERFAEQLENDPNLRAQIDRLRGRR